MLEKNTEWNKSSEELHSETEDNKRFFDIELF